MPCVCQQCLQHGQTLGLTQSPTARSALRKAYRTAAKLWHPDRFERDPDRRLEAEERFKQIQIAFRELAEHLETPVEWPVEPAFAPPAPTPVSPPIFFGGAPGCFVAPDFSPVAERIILAHVREPDRALAIVDLSGPGAEPGTFTQYILLTGHGLVVRDALNLVSLLWYDHLGEIRLVDKRRKGKLGLWHRFLENVSGTEQKYILEIRRRDGSLFHAVASQVDDSIKIILYNFLQQRRPEPRR